MKPIPTFDVTDVPAFPRPALVPDVKAIEAAGEHGRRTRALETFVARVCETVRPKKAA